MNRSLKLSMLIALALGSSQALALDLGQVQVKSALGQPLLAEIPLHPANPAELQNLTAQLASSEEFARAGIVGGRTTIPLHFSVVRTSAGHEVIRITSSVAVDDPYLDLLIEVNGKAGKSVREFAILLDPPGATAAAPTAVAAAPAHARTAAPAKAHAPATATPAAKAAPVADHAEVGNGKYGPVERGQTLSGIARNVAPAGVDVHQMLLALKQANPDAFYRDNINALKSGAVLRVPTSAEAQAMTIAAAVAEVRRQNSDWRAGTPAAATAVVADTATRAAASSAPTSTRSSGDRLALLPAKEGGSAAGRGDKSAESMRQDLLRTQESLASVQQQSSDLKTRLKDLTDINNKNEHLLSLKDSEIAELQAKLAAARKAANLPPAPAVAASTPEATAAAAQPTTSPAAAGTSGATAGTGSMAASAGSTADTGALPAATASTTAMIATPAAAGSAPATSASAPVATAAIPAPAKPVSKPAIKPSSPAPEPVQPWYMQTWTWAAGGAAIVLLILLAILGRRKPTTGSKSASSLADRFSPVAATEQDILGGDDVDQEELLDQLAEHPDDIGLHLELVTLYYSRRDVEHFEAAAEAMHAHITDPQQDEWQDVLHMGEDLVPGHPLFDHHPELPAHDDADTHGEFDIDDYADNSDAPTVVSTMPPLPQAPKKVSEYSFNFDLTTPPVRDPAKPSQPTADDDATVVAPVVAPSHDYDAAPVESDVSSRFDELERAQQAIEQNGNMDEFNDDPVDTKLDLARAYLDMGDADGARAMLGEVVKEGSQMQRDTAKRLLENLH